MNIENLTQEELVELSAKLEARKKEYEKKIQEDRETYKKLVSETVLNLWSELEAVSGRMMVAKGLVFESFEDALKLKKDAYGIKDNQQSYTFSTEDGKRSITIGHRIVDRYDETVTAGISKVKEYVKSLAKDEASAALVDTILNLLKPNKDGVLKASRVLELEKLANRVNNAEFTDGLRIIKEAYKPTKTCQFVTVKYKDEKGAEHTLPLSMSAID
jgi:hypothetical protein